MVMNLYREIDRSRFQFDFAYFTADNCDYDDEIEALGGRIYRICAKNPAARFLALRKLMRKGTWRIVHSHTLFSSALHLAAARLAGVPQRVTHSHSTQDANSSNLPGRLYQQIARWLLNRVCTKRIACGIAAAEYLFPNCPDVTVIPNAVNIERFANASPDALRTELNFREGQLVILQVGRFMRVKNHVRSVEIACTLRTFGVDFQLLLVGTGPEQHHIERLVSEHGLQNHVRMLGLRADIPELMAVADVMLMPSLHEGFPVVLVESQAAGLPSVISNTISKEVDLGLDLVTFVGLEAHSDEWMKHILKAAGVGMISIETRHQALEKLGFSSRAGANRLASIYLKQ